MYTFDLFICLFLLLFFFNWLVPLVVHSYKNLKQILVLVFFRGTIYLLTKKNSVSLTIFWNNHYSSISFLS